MESLESADGLKLHNVTAMAAKLQGKRRTWTKVRIEVRGDKARLFVHGNEQPALIVNDVKSGAGARGAVALWLGAGAIAHFRALTVTP